MRKLITLLRQDRARLKILAETIWHLMSARRLVHRSDFATYKTTLGQPTQGEVATSPLPDNKVLHDIRWAITAIDRSTGHRFTCLMQGIAAQRMLARRGIPYALVFGAKLGSTSDSRTDGDSMAAHAWLRAGGAIVVGDKERAIFAPIVSYVG